MDWIILIVITLLSAIAGYRKGALRMVLRLISFIAGYVVAWKLTPILAQWFIDTHKLQGVIVYPAAGLTLFFGTGIALNIVFSILYWLVPTTIKEGGKPVGATLGGLFGLLFAILCIWTIGIVHSAIIQREHANNPDTPIKQVSPSTVQKIAGNIISKTTQAALGDNNPAITLTSQALSDPTSVSQELNYLSKQPDVRELFSDADNYRAMVNGTPNDIMQLPSFQNLINDQQAMAFLSKAGLAGNTTQEKQLTLANNFSTYAKNMEKIKNTPEYRDIITDPEITTKLKERDYVALLTNEKVRLLTEMLISGHVATQNIASGEGQARKNKKIFQWKDKSGGMHYSEQPPIESNVVGEVKEIQH